MTALVVARSAAALELIAAARTLAGSTGPALLVSYSTAVIPELASPPPFDRWLDGTLEGVVDLTAQLAPYHPQEWRPADTELPLLRRLLSAAWTPDVDELWVEDLDDPPAATLARIFDSAPIHLASPGLLAYGPPGTRRPQPVQGRVVRTWYRPLVPGLVPVPAGEATAVPLPVVPRSARTGPVLVLGADLSGAGLLEPDAEIGLHSQLLAAAGRQAVAFSPHPATAPAQRWRIERAATAAGVRLTTVTGRPDALITALAPRLVVGCASGALLRVRAGGNPVRGIGAAELLSGMSPYHHRDRIPLTIADAVLRPDGGYERPDRLQALVDSVAYVMRPQSAPELREATAEFLSGLDEPEWRRYFRKHRVERLGLPVPAERAVQPRWAAAGRAGRPR